MGATSNRERIVWSRELVLAVYTRVARETRNLIPDAEGANFSLPVSKVKLVATLTGMVLARSLRSGLSQPLMVDGITASFINGFDPAAGAIAHSRGGRNQPCRKCIICIHIGRIYPGACRA